MRLPIPSIEQISNNKDSAMLWWFLGLFGLLLISLGSLFKYFIDAKDEMIIMERNIIIQKDKEIERKDNQIRQMYYIDNLEKQMKEDTVR